MKFLNGAELADYIKVRQAKQVRALRQAWHVFPRLAIIQTIDDPVITTYVNSKKSYGRDILIDVDVHRIDQGEILPCIKQLNADDTVHGIIIQLPLSHPDETQAILDAVDSEKDVDGLGSDAIFEPATPMAISWLLAGYNVDLKHKKIAIIGNGRLVGRPLAKMWQASGYDLAVFDKKTDNLKQSLQTVEVIVSATGVPGLLTSEMIPIDTVVVDAGVASEEGRSAGDVASSVYKRNDLSITPQKGGVGPLTVAALFDNVIRAAQLRAEKKTISSQ